MPMTDATTSEATTFLLIEDDPDDAFFVEREFKKAPAHLRVRHVANGDTAVRYLQGEDEYADRQKYPIPHVILLDLHMPGISGFEFLDWLHSQSPGELRLIPVVVMSSSTSQDHINQVYALGANSYMTKPINWGAFKERIKTLGIYWAEHVEKPEIPPP